jgi:hypothetical protein
MPNEGSAGRSQRDCSDFLSRILGAHRKSVTLAAESMQTTALISYRRGKNWFSTAPVWRRGIMRMLRDRKGAFRCLPDTALDRNTGSGHNKPNQEQEDREGLTCWSIGKLSKVEAIRKAEKWPEIVTLRPLLTTGQYLNCGIALSWSLVALYMA